MYGYFKAAKRFFGPAFNEKDIGYVAKQLGAQLSEISLQTLHDANYRRLKNTVLKHFGCTEFDERARKIVALEIRSMVRSQTRPRLMFEQVVEILICRKIEVPSFHLLSELIAAEINAHKRQLVTLTESLLTEKAKKLLDRLLESNDDSRAKLKRYYLTLIKTFSHSLQPSAIKSNVEQLLALRELYSEVKPVIEKLDLTREGLRYFATHVLKSPTWKLTAREENDRYLHIITFVAHQYYQLQDLLVDVLLSSVTAINNTARREHKEICYEQRSLKNSSLANIIETVEELLSGYAEIHGISHKQGLHSDRKIELIKKLLKENESTISDARKHISNLKQTQGKKDIDFYSILESKSLKLQNRVAAIIKALEFRSDCADRPLYNALCHYRDKDGAVSDSPPCDFLTPVDLSPLRGNDGKFRVPLYKVLLFVKITEAIRAGTLNLEHSYKYRTLEDYLIARLAWDEGKTTLIERASLQGVENCPKVLNDLQGRLEQYYQLTNQRILDGNNEHVSIKSDGAYTVQTPPVAEKLASGLHDYFPETKFVSLLEILSTTNQVTDFLGEFQRSNLKYNRARPSERSFFAGMLGLGCGIGIKRMAQISSLIDEAELERTVNWHFSLENVDAANDRILAFMDKLELPSVYLQDSDLRHTSSDGQKIEVVVPSLNANYSFKYFGQGKGVSAYSFIDERHFLFHSTVISSAEREAAYVIDGLMHNDVVKSDIHSTDTHGYSEMIFGATHLLGFMFAPRIKSLGRQHLYTFPGNSKKLYKDRKYPILPDGIINTQLITENWDEILRFIATIKLKETPASQLFRRLNSYSKAHPLWEALKEFGKVVKSIFILNYIDDLNLRQAIEKQLNKIESAQKFSNAVAFGSQELRQADREEQNIVVACRRLIKNSIICWNYLYLSQKIVNAPSAAHKKEILDAVQNGSIVAWRHINFYGEYDFSDEKLRDSVGVTAPLTQKLKIA
jgi:TnpA family transposase